jgi:hypothetical protein
MSFIISPNRHPPLEMLIHQSRLPVVFVMITTWFVGLPNINQSPWHRFLVVVYGLPA